MLVLRALPALLLVACAGPSGSTLERGTMTRPPPAQHRPGVGAPMLGQPGSASAVPRSPHKRVLPRSEGPGIWAGDESAPEPALLGVGIPLPKDTLELIPVNQCLGWAQRTLAAEPASRDTLAGASENRRKCIADNIMAQCLLELVSQGEQAQSRGERLHEEGFRALKSVHDLAQRRAKRSCSGIVPVDVEHEAQGRVVREMVERMNGR
jgi:hypothetical protein